MNDHTELDADDELGSSIPWGWIACVLVAGAAGIVDLLIR
jgi:hypothetical protein